MAVSVEGVYSRPARTAVSEAPDTRKRKKKTTKKKIKDRKAVGCRKRAERSGKRSALLPSTEGLGELPLGGIKGGERGMGKLPHPREPGVGIT